MLSKLTILILAIGVISCTLLGIRQHRVQAAHEMALVQRRVAQHDKQLWQMRTEIAKVITPSKVEAMGSNIGKLATIRDERYIELVRLETQLAEESALTAISEADPKMTVR